MKYAPHAIIKAVAQQLSTAPAISPPIRPAVDLVNGGLTYGPEDDATGVSSGCIEGDGEGIGIGRDDEATGDGDMDISGDDMAGISDDMAGSASDEATGEYIGDGEGSIVISGDGSTVTSGCGAGCGTSTKNSFSV